MSDLRDQVPEFSPDREAGIDIGLTALAAGLPGFGGVVADLARGMLARQTQQRQHEFDLQVAEGLAEITRQAASWTPVEIFRNPEFMAAHAKAARFAAETASLTKRARLARALVRSGPWSDLTLEKREFFLDVAAQYNDLHVFLLVFASSPMVWLDEHAPTWRHDSDIWASPSPYRVEAHPLGGRHHYFRVGAREFSILDSDYPHADDFEIHERQPDGDRRVVPGTERRAETWDAAIALIAADATVDIDVIFERYVFPDSEDWAQIVGPAINDIAAMGFAEIPVGRPRPLAEVVGKLTHEFGDEFLVFLGDG